MEDLVGAILAVVELVEVGEGVILFECCFMNEDEVVNFERERNCFMSIMFDHGFASFD